MPDAQCTLKNLEQIRGGVIATIEGEITFTASPHLRKQLLELAKQNHGVIVLDVAAVPYMDSSGVAVLVEMLSKLRGTNTKLVICCMQDRVRSMFDIARLSKLFTIVDSRTTATST
jgi:anti-anti-sigma factor